MTFDDGGFYEYAAENLVGKLASPSGSMLLVNKNHFMKTYGAWLVHVVERCTAVR